MVLDLVVLLISFAAWIATLWLAIAPDFTRWSNPGTMALHVVPPLIAGFAWMFVRRRIRRRNQMEAEAREQQAQIEREAAREAARTKHEDAMARRRFGCDCRFVAMTGVAVSSDLPLLGGAVDNIEVQS